MSGERIGLLGGTFDPIHIGHLHLAQAVADVAALDTVLFMPVGSPAHRETHASAEDRKEMTQLAIARNTRFEFDGTALEQPAPAYTADTLALLREKRPHDRFCFIAGIDSLARSRWRRLDEVAETLEKFYVARREGVDVAELAPILSDLAPELRARFEIVDVALMDLSSTEIRALVKAGRSIRYLVPDVVAGYIADRSLYR
ncbi:MAG TPA: nicotinate-nucleotide adenylyltransferase [Candidatus Eremiobacteraceae bacterium]|nr:nicotinate-nucleotide adenylyltransferase [Candidatus Eremiobacteraceae bacterium]